MPTIPANAPKPQDHKPPRKRTTAARKAEANGNGNGRLVIEQCGIELSIPRAHGQWPLAAIDAFADGNHVKGIKALLGQEQWDALVAAGAVADDLNDLGEKFQEAIGLDAGN